MQSFRLRPGIYVEHLPQGLPACPVLLEGETDLLPRGVVLHQRPVCRLLQRIDRKHPLRRRGGRFGRPIAKLMRQELSAGIDGDFVQPLLLVAQNVLHERAARTEAGQKFVPVGIDCELQRRRRPSRSRSFEGAHIRFHRRRVERQGVVFGDQGTGRDHLERLAERPERLAETGAGLGFAPIGPQQAHQLVAAVRFARPERKKGQQQARLIPGNGDFAARIVADLEAAEHRQAQREHRLRLW